MMVDKIMCPSCHKLNDIHKFCVYCGKELPINDERIRLMNDNPEAYCLNCGRPAKKGQTKCECGYEFAEIKCPECNAKNVYANRFCTSCGKKLWESDVLGYKYSERLFENHFLNETLPYSLRNTSLYKRSTNRSSWIGENTFPYTSDNLDLKLVKLRSEDLDADKNLYEICSRWKIISPKHCISCLKISSGTCACMAPYLTNEKRIESLQSEKNNYIKPRFDIEELKWTSKNKPETYLGSLAPAIGESQLEYRERLKWEFAANVDRKNKIKNAINNINNTLNRRKSEPSTFKTNSKRGGYCGLSCKHCYEEFFDSGGGIVGDFDSGGYTEYYCHLGHTISHGSFCEDYE